MEALKPTIASCSRHRLEERAAREDAQQETLLAVNRLWDELNASIAFVQYRSATTCTSLGLPNTTAANMAAVA
jgi:hypothetical protein